MITGIIIFTIMIGISIYLFSLKRSDISKQYKVIDYDGTYYTLMRNNNLYRGLPIINYVEVEKGDIVTQTKVENDIIYFI